MRAILNYITRPERLLKSLGIAATLNEVAFVAAPVAASLLGSMSLLLLSPHQFLVTYQTGACH